MAKKDVMIKDAPLVDALSGEEKIPISDGSGEPKSTNINGIKDFIGDSYELVKLSEEVGKKVDVDQVATINGQSLLNGGNIEIKSSSSYDDTEIKQELTELSAEVGKKQDTITDLATIRSGAAKGATAIQSVKTINGQSIVGSGNIEIQGGGGSGGDDTSLREAIFGKTTSKEFAINGYHAATADTLAVNIAQGEMFRVRVDSLGAEISRFTIMVKYVGASSFTQVSHFRLNKTYSIYAIQDIAEVSVSTSSSYVTTKGNVRLSVTQGGLSQPYNFMNFGEVNITEDMTSLNVLEKIPDILKFTRIKVLCEFKYASDRVKNGTILLNDDGYNAIAIDNLFQSAISTCYILDITLDQFRVDAYIECHSNSFANIQTNDGNQGRNFGKTINGNNINAFIINLPLLAGDKFIFYGK